MLIAHMRCLCKYKSLNKGQGSWRLLQSSFGLTSPARNLQVAVQSGPEASEEQRVIHSVATPEEFAVLVRRNLPSVQLPTYLVEGIEALTAQAAGSSKRLRQNSQALTERLKQQSRSTARGGLQPLSPAEGSERFKGTPRKKQSWRITARQIRHSDIVELGEGFNEQLDRDFAHPEEIGSGAALPDIVKYDAAESFGYIAARLPGCYATARRVFDEIAFRLPQLHPHSMLDFGAGPGTAIWAASDTWENGPAIAHAVELSPAMRWSGQQIEQHYEQHCSQQAASQPGSQTPVQSMGEKPSALSQGEVIGGEGTEKSSKRNAMASRSIRWLQHLRGYRDRKGLEHPSMRRTVWVQSTGGRRYQLVVASYSLGELPNQTEQRRALKALWDATEDVLVLIEPGTPSGSALVRAARAQVLAWETNSAEERSAHVVAPCPHDGACPMDGTRSWCHFSQRFERTRLQRHSKVRAGRPLPRGHQDERFSYVVLKRGPRVGARSELVLQEHLDWLLQPVQQPAASAEDSPEKQGEDLEDPAVLQLIQESIGAGEDDDDDADSLSREIEPFSEDLMDSDLPSNDATAQKAMQDNSLQSPSQDNSRSARIEINDSSQQNAAESSLQWSRIVRPPRKRPGHVVIDICAAAGSQVFSPSAIVQGMMRMGQPEEKSFSRLSALAAEEIGWGLLHSVSCGVWIGEIYGLLTLNGMRAQDISEPSCSTLRNISLSY